MHELLFERAAIRNDHDSRNRVQQNPVSFGNQIRAAKKYAAGLVYQGLRATYADKPLQFILQRLSVAGRMIIQDDQVKNETLQAQVLVAAQELTHHAQVALFADPHESNRQVAADAIRPEARLISGVERKDV